MTPSTLRLTARIALFVATLGLFATRASAPGRAEEPHRRLAAEAEEAGRTGQMGVALGKWQEAWEKSPLGAFRLWVEGRVAASAASLTEPQLLVEAARLPAGSRIRALVEARRAERLVAAGKEDQARALVGKIAAGLDPEERRALLARAGHPDTFDALLPLTGPLRVLGRQILRGYDSAFQIEDVIFEQYTGLKDKNDKEIYEGDIVQVLESTFHWGAPKEYYFLIGIVEFDLKFLTYSINFKFNDTKESLVDYGTDEIEIITQAVKNSLSF